jgi:hypothetical protein
MNMLFLLSPITVKQLAPLAEFQSSRLLEISQKSKLVIHPLTSRNRFLGFSLSFLNSQKEEYMKVKER